ncbi:hypothetical protein J437_LFUL012981 [Ladona fulva]|uniref:Carboxylesterase type B domain-containing protein n=1 Tax=Ladona fulva TaxID=123851 RepID=A0A8K0P1T1_LADFU|nr:hypothetical protein J437_LFUL012981 [Ladona fulva]
MDFLVESLKINKTRKDGDADTEEGKDLLEASSNPSSQAGASGGQKSRLAVFEKIKLPKTFLKKSKDKPQDGGGNKGAEENTGDKPTKADEEKEAIALNVEDEKDAAGEPDDGMETVKLESDVDKPQDGGGNKGAEENTGDKPTKADEEKEAIALNVEDEKDAAGEPDDGMETVKLESDVHIQSSETEKVIIGRKFKKSGQTGNLEVAKEIEWLNFIWIRMRFTPCGILLFLLLIIVIIAIAASAGGDSKQDMLESSADFLHVEGQAVTAITSCGPVQGWVEDNAFAFRGIPYALPPVGKLRWKLPVPLQRLEHCWNGTFVTANVTNPPNACWQTFRNGSLDGSEDCLTVDVFAPRLKRNSPRLPVVVLVAAETLGGGGGKGAISPQLLTPKLAKAANVILIRVRFRLGVLGFLAAKALTHSVYPRRSGNYGLADVRAALEWININAAGFGGDASSITVLGHRAGATLVLALAASRKAPQLFSRVWISGPAAGFPNFTEKSLLEAEREGDDWVRTLACGEVAGERDAEIVSACLARMDVEDLLDAVPRDWNWRAMDLPRREEKESLMHRWLIADGTILKEHPKDGWTRHGLHVPIVFGTTSHGEATAELRRRKDWSEPKTVAEHVQNSTIGEKGLTEEALQLYSSPSFPPSSGSSSESPPPLARLTAMITDIRTICPLIDLARSAAKHAKNVPVYFYTAASLPEEAGSIGAVPESQDEPDVASAVVGPGADMAAILSHPLREAEGGQSSAMARMFYTYVRHGPTSNTTAKINSGEEDEMEKVDAWPEAKLPTRLMLLGPDGKVESIADYPRCEFWTKSEFVPAYARLD